MSDASWRSLFGGLLYCAMLFVCGMGFPAWGWITYYVHMDVYAEFCEVPADPMTRDPQPATIGLGTLWRNDAEIVGSETGGE